MRYIETKEGRTPRYYGTVELVDGKSSSEELAKLRRAISNLNKSCDTKHYVKLHGRGTRKGVPHWNKELPLKEATHADVYVYERFF